MIRADTSSDPATSAGGDGATRFILSLLGPSREAPGEVDWVTVAALLELHGLGPLAAMEAEAGAVHLPDPLRQDLEGPYRATALRTSLVLETGERARAALVDAGIEAVVFKGAALVADGTYGPGGRPMDDVDLLVRADRARDAVRVLQGRGFRPWTPWTEGRDRWLDSMSFTDAASPPGMPAAVDLHWRTDYGSLRFGDPEGGSVLWRGADLDRGLPAPTAHLLLVTEHVLKHLRFRTHFPGLADVVRLARRVDDWNLFTSLAARHPTAPAVGLILDLLRRGAGAPVPAQVAASLGGGGRWISRAAPLLAPERLVGRSSVVQSRAGGLALRWILAGSPGAGVRDAARAAFPTRRWLAARYGSGAPGSVLWLRYAFESTRWLIAGGASPASPNQGPEPPAGADGDGLPAPPAPVDTPSDAR